MSDVESDGAGLIAVLLEARALHRGGPGPIVVHCSSGTGRTGTLIALDLGIRQYEITRTVDVPRVVYTIRRDRAGAVQTKEQYALIYKVIVRSMILSIALTQCVCASFASFSVAGNCKFTRSLQRHRRKTRFRREPRFKIKLFSSRH